MSSPSIEVGCLYEVCVCISPVQCVGVKVNGQGIDVLEVRGDKVGPSRAIKGCPAYHRDRPPVSPKHVSSGSGQRVRLGASGNGGVHLMWEQDVL